MQNGYKTKSRSYIMEFFTAHKEQIVSAADIHHYLEENGQAGQSGNDLPESRQDDGRRHFVKI